MVVTRKTPVAPVPTGSRTNSSQPLPRAAKQKTSSALADSELAVPRDSLTPAAKNAATSQKPPTKSRHKNRHHKKAPKPSSSFLDQLVYLSIFLLGLYAFTTCPKDDTLSNPVCRSLSQYRIHVLEPYVLPPIQRALSHPSVAPYVEKAERLERETIRPVVLKTAAFSAPYATHAKRAVWDSAVVPAYTAYVVPQWRAHILPPWNKHVSPHIARATPYAVRTQRSLEATAAALHKTYSKRVKPAAVQTYVIVKPYAIRGYRAARPHALTLYAHVRALGALGAAKAGAARREYVDPHVVRIWDKVLELSGAGPVGSPTEQAVVPTPEPEAPASTAATTEEATAEVVASATSSVAAVVTPVEVTSSTPAVTAEEEVSSTTPSSTPTPSKAPVSASSVVPPPAAETIPPVAEKQAKVTPAAVKEELSAASVVQQSAHGMESPVVEEIIADVESSTVKAVVTEVPSETEAKVVETGTAAAVETETAAPIEELSAASVVVQSAHGMESPVVEEIIAAVDPVATVVPEPEEEDDDGAMDDFLSDIGLVEEEPEEGEQDEEDVPQLTPREIRELERISAEEQAEAKVRKTAEKRADLEGRMARSKETLTAMVVAKNKQLRKTLVGLRKAAVARMDDPLSIIGSQLPALEREADKLLKGLEGYLKKDVKVNKGGDPVERTERWQKVVTKVEEKISEKIQMTQGVIQQFHVDLKAEEVNEGMAIIQEVKDACSRAQGDVGLDLSWLDDVTYMDWAVYHKLAEIGEDFQAEASEIQAGTHAHPPVDPFIKRLEKMQTDLTTHVNSLVARIAKINQRATAAFALGVEPPAEPEPAADAAEPEPEAEASPAPEADEPRVSILPVHPIPPAAPADDFDPAQVVIGKSAAQVAEALRNAEPAPVPPHEEL
ncbi:hypothetical protein C8R44DRAFT_849879 [Mycena epipterygia]|nr:hypothetical protein C8R44DRAFT_849879 [Mycena epipterygia]